MLPRSSPTRATITVVAIAVAGLWSGSIAGGWAADHATDPYASLERFARVLTTVETRHADPQDPDALVTAAIRGLVDTLDPHSRWLSPEEARAIREGNASSYEGIGVDLRVVADGVLVAAVLPGGPAERAGLLREDLLLAADGADLRGLDLVEVSGVLEGPRGEPVALTVRRAGWEADRVIRVVRDRIEKNPVESARLGDVAYLRLLHFQHGAGAAVRSALDAQLAEGPLAGVVLDLRDNPGGVLDEAVAVCDLFLDEGPIVSTRGRGEAEERHEATPGGVGPSLRLVVLVNSLSASASEIVAGALQVTGRATLVGTRTYGKGSVQVLFEHRDGSALKLTTSRYYLPNGEPVAAAVGRVPDVVVRLSDAPSPADALRAGLTAQLPEGPDRDALLALVDALDEGEAPPEPEVRWELPPAERLAADAQLARAVAVVRGE